MPDLPFLYRPYMPDLPFLYRPYKPDLPFLYRPYMGDPLPPLLPLLPLCPPFRSAFSLVSVQSWRIENAASSHLWAKLYVRCVGILFRHSHLRPFPEIISWFAPTFVHFRGLYPGSSPTLINISIFLPENLHIPKIFRTFALIFEKTDFHSPTLILITPKKGQT